MYYIEILNIDSFLSSIITKKSLSQPKNGLHRSLCHYKQLCPKLFTGHLKPLMLGIHYIFNVVTHLLNYAACIVYSDPKWLSTNYLLSTYYCLKLTMYITRHVLYGNLCLTCFDDSARNDCLAYFDHSNCIVVLIE